MEREYGTFGVADQLNFAMQFYEAGRLLILVTDCPTHGTHGKHCNIGWWWWPNTIKALLPGHRSSVSKSANHGWGPWKLEPRWRAPCKAVKFKCSVIK